MMTLQELAPEIFGIADHVVACETDELIHALIHEANFGAAVEQMEEFCSELTQHVFKGNTEAFEARLKCLKQSAQAHCQTRRKLTEEQIEAVVYRQRQRMNGRN